MMYTETFKLPATQSRKMGEFRLIQEINGFIRKHYPTDSSVIVDIGDDAAVIKTRTKKFLVATVDGMIEHIHFSLDTNDWYSIGWKSAAMNFSDLAAMGALPRWLLVQLTLTDSIPFNAVRQLYKGLGDCAVLYDAHIAGGNCARSENECSIIVTALGEVHPKKIIKRSGARIGDRIVITGYPGLSSAGFHYLTDGTPHRSSAAIRRHLRPVPRVEEIHKLLTAGIRIHAAIDISDGLTADLSHICESSGVGAMIERAAIPLHPALRRLAGKKNEDPYKMAFSGGEDYELILTMPESAWLKAQRLLPSLTTIGQIIKKQGLYIRETNQKIIKLQPQGYTHF